MSSNAGSLFAKARVAMESGNQIEAIRIYSSIQRNHPALSGFAGSMLAIARQRFRQDRHGQRLKVAVSGWELAHNAAGRAFALAEIHQRYADVQIVGCIFPKWGRELWAPVRKTTIPVSSIIVDRESAFIEDAAQMVLDHPADVVHLAKPRMPNIIIGALYKYLWGATVIVDVDDDEIAIAGKSTSTTSDGDPIKENGDQAWPKLVDLAGAKWTNIAVDLIGSFDGVTVCNEILRARHGGVVIRHARDERKYTPIKPESREAVRKRHGIPLEQKIVLFFGTPRAHKGLIETAEAIAELKRQDVSFCVVGDFADKELERHIAEIQGCNLIRLPNQPITKAPEIIALGDCCVLNLDKASPIAAAQTPAKLTDALSMGLPVIAEAGPGFDDLINVGAVHEIKNGNVAGAIEQVLFDLKLRSQLIRQGRIAFEQSYSVKACALAMEAAVSDACGASNKGRQANERLFGLIPWLKKEDLSALAQIPQRQWTELVSEPSVSNGGGQRSMTLPNLQEATESYDVDIVVPVYNALEDVQRCLKSLQECKDSLKCRVIVVNDGSDQATTYWLRDFCNSDASICLIEHEKNQGYTRTVNDGLKRSTAPYVITQNSDTIVSKGWLNGLIRCMNSDSKLGIVGPLSNAASWQNVPKLLDEKGGFAVNGLPDGFGVDEMAKLVSEASVRSYPKTTFINGFCFMIRREVIASIGYMDEENFPVGYGEENDFCIRAADAGYLLAVADDTYVYHAKSKSFGHQQRQLLSSQGSEKLRQKHGAEKYKQKLEAVKNTAALDLVRSNISKALEIICASDGIEEVGSIFTGNPPKILFLLPVKGGGGGSHSVVQEAAEMRRMGLNVRVAVKQLDLNNFQRSYSDIRLAEELFLGFEDVEIFRIASEFDVVIATVYSSVKLLQEVVSRRPDIMPAYYVQDYEPMFFKKGSAKWKEANDSYVALSGACLFAKTEWIGDEVFKHHGVRVKKVQPSIDHDVYMPRPKKAKGKLVIAAMIRPQTPRRGAERTMRVLKRLAERYGDSLAFEIFGCESNNPSFISLERDFHFSNRGEIDRAGVAELLAASDIFIDLSDYQAFGRTALEAMACGCAAIIPKMGGGDEYARSNVNSLVVDTKNEDEIFDAVCGLVDNRRLLHTLKANGLATAAAYSVHSAAVSEVIMLEKALAKWRKDHPNQLRAELIVIPNVGADGDSLVGSAYVRLVYPLNAVGVLKKWKPSVQNTLLRTGEGRVAVLQREVFGKSFEALKEWVSWWKSSGRKIIHEIDDDLLDVHALYERGYGPKAQETSEKVRYLLEQSDRVHVSTALLGERIRGIARDIRVVPNVLDKHLWKLNESRLHSEGKFARGINGCITIGYIGTPTHNADLKLIAEAMKRVALEYPGRVKIEVIGAFQKIDPFFGERVSLPKNSDYPNFVRWLHERVHWDIGVIPLVKDNFNRSKSNLKFLEYAALDMAIVVSDHEVYAGISKNMENCLVVGDSVEDWVQALRRLIEDSDLRSALSRAARIEVANKYSTDAVSPIWLESLDGLV